MNNNPTIENWYTYRCQTPSDINEHLPVLYRYAKECETIAEFGVRTVVSSFAFAHSRPKKLICVDIETNNAITMFLELCKNEQISAEFIQASTLEYELPHNVDLLFIDTLHTYEQLAKELELHAAKANKYLIFHDTISFGHTNENNVPGQKQGLVLAIKEFLQINPQWREKETYPNNNGLTVLERVS